MRSRTCSHQFSANAATIAALVAAVSKTVTHVVHTPAMLALHRKPGHGAIGAAGERHPAGAVTLP